LGSRDLSLTISVHFRDAAIDMAKNASEKQTKGKAPNVKAVILRIFLCRSVMDRKKQHVLSMYLVLIRINLNPVDRTIAAYHSS
jgi:hypothetical protein